MGRLGRFIIEYVGNLEPLHREDRALGPPPADRRTNYQNRELVEWVKGQMEDRGFPAARKHQFVDDLRRALRQGDRMPDGVSDDERGFSRDAPA